MLLSLHARHLPGRILFQKEFQLNFFCFIPEDNAINNFVD
jgi:hypothetical protein